MNVNERLRAHVTSTTFVLTLGATHIAALAHIDHELRRNRSLNEDLAEGTLRDIDPPQGNPLRRAFRHNATGMNGLIARGLATHTYTDKATGAWRPSDIWTITPAGRHVIGLLQEAGIWQEYADALPAEPEPEPARAKRRRAA